MHMNSSTINVKTDEETKRQFKEFAAEVGLPVSALLNALIKQTLRSRKVEFGVGLLPTPYLEKAIAEAEDDYNSGQNIMTVSSAEDLGDMFDDL